MLHHVERLKSCTCTKTTKKTRKTESVPRNTMFFLKQEKNCFNTNGINLYEISRVITKYTFMHCDNDTTQDVF